MLVLHSSWGVGFPSEWDYPVRTGADLTCLPPGNSRGDDVGSTGEGDGTVIVSRCRTHLYGLPSG